MPATTWGIKYARKKHGEKWEEALEYGIVTSWNQKKHAYNVRYNPSMSATFSNHHIHSAA
jgi:hypothetical protein